MTLPSRGRTLLDCTALPPAYPLKARRGGQEGESGASRPSLHSDRDIVSWCAAMLRESPAGRCLADQARARGWHMGLADAPFGGFHLDPARARFWVDAHGLSPAALGRSEYFRGAILRDAIRALRAIWHTGHFGAYPPRSFAPEACLLAERVRQADAATVAVLAAWEMRCAGHPEIWRHMIGSSEGDMAMVFAERLEKTACRLPERPGGNGAMVLSFCQWFLSECRVAEADHETLETLDDLIAAAGPDKGPVFGRGRLDAAQIEARTRLEPSGESYLRGYGGIIEADPAFTAVSDPINQSHLLQILCEIETVTVDQVTFRDPLLARRIFPDEALQRER